MTAGPGVLLLQQRLGPLGLLALQTLPYLLPAARSCRPTAAAFSPDGRLLAIALKEGAGVWNAIRGGTERFLLEGHDGGVNDIAFSPSGKHIATAGDDRTVRLWDAATGRELLRLSGHQAAVKSVRFSPDGMFLLSGSDDHTARLWDVRSGAEQAALKGHARAILSAEFRPDGHRIVTADGETVRLWDVAGRRNSGWCCAVIASSWSPWNSARATLWDVATGTMLALYRGHAGPVHLVAFSPDEQRVATGTSDGTARVWPVDLWPSILRRRPRELTSAERERYEVVEPGSPSANK
jgi:WD40 repeat protein